MFFFNRNNLYSSVELWPTVLLFLLLILDPHFFIYQAICQTKVFFSLHFFSKYFLKVFWRSRSQFAAHQNYLAAHVFLAAAQQHD